MNGEDVRVVLPSQGTWIKLSQIFFWSNVKIFLWSNVKIFFSSAVADQTDPTSATGVTYFEKICISNGKYLFAFLNSSLTSNSNFLFANFNFSRQITIFEPSFQSFTCKLIKLSTCLCVKLFPVARLFSENSRNIFLNIPENTQTLALANSVSIM